MNNNLDHLIPLEILDYLNLNLIDIKIVIQPYAARHKWPSLCVSVDGHSVFNGTVTKVQNIEYRSKASPQQKMCVVDIEYYGKGDNDTVIGSHNSIVENQGLEIKELWINSVDVIKTGMIHNHIGHYTMKLSNEKRKYFVEHGINISPTTSTQMFENGVWHIELALPLLSTLTSKHNFTEPWEDENFDSLVDELFRLLEVCENLEKNA